MSKLRVVSLADLQAQEGARLAALDVPTTAQVLLVAVRRLADQEARRIKVPFLDPTYHGCDPAWRDALNAARDLAVVLAREQTR